MTMATALSLIIDVLFLAAGFFIIQALKANKNLFKQHWERMDFLEKWIDAVAHNNTEKRKTK